MLPGAPRGPPTGLSLRNHCATWISVGPVQGQKPHAGHMNRVQASLLGRLLGGTRIPAEKCQYLEIRPILFPHRKHHQSTLLPHDAQSQVYLRPDLRASALRTYIWLLPPFLFSGRGRSCPRTPEPLTSSSGIAPADGS